MTTVGHKQGQAVSPNPSNLYSTTAENGTFIATAVGSLFVQVAGKSTGETLVFWHVLYADSRLWQAQVELLKSNHRLLLIDGPAHGGSRENRRSFTIEQCAEALIQVLDTFQITQAIGIGLGWGGLTVLQAAISAPKRLRALVVFDSAFVPQPWLMRVKMLGMARFIGRFGFTKTAQKLIASTLLSPNTLQMHPEIVASFTQQMREVNPQGVYEAVSSLLNRSSLIGLEQIQLPTLLLVGEQDRVYPPHNSEQLAKLIPGAKLVRLVGAGHLGPMEVPNQVNAILQKFIASIY